MTVLQFCRTVSIPLSSASSLSSSFSSSSFFSLSFLSMEPVMFEETQGMWLNVVPYESVLSALTKITREKGLRGLYSGIVPSLAGVSHVVIQFLTYEKIKSYIAKKGILGVYLSCATNLLRTTPSVIITFTSYEVTPLWPSSDAPTIFPHFLLLPKLSTVTSLTFPHFIPPYQTAQSSSMLPLLLGLGFLISLNSSPYSN
ncbi:hypothetical protein RYX36_012263 [Vicia faba]